ncbi:uncharacterized protein LOC134687382 [Mytilus trossulus]|uniref:uncharacterized protein LOC134687382 n=1 Tax=Mytilus trossulus TaxID=6551 RepID=UPI003007DDCB
MFEMSECESNYTEIQVTVYVVKPELLHEQKKTNGKSDKKALYGHRDVKERCMSSLCEFSKRQCTERNRDPKILPSRCKFPVIRNMGDREELHGLGQNVKCKTNRNMGIIEHVDTSDTNGLRILNDNVENCCYGRRSDFYPEASSTIECNIDENVDNIECQSLPDTKNPEIQNVIHEILKHNDIKTIYGQQGEMVYNSEIKFNKPLIQCDAKEVINKVSKHCLVEESLSAGNKIRRFNEGTYAPKLVLNFQTDFNIVDSDKCDTRVIKLKDDISLKKSSNTTSAMGEKRCTLKMQQNNDININRKCFDKTTKHASLQDHFKDVSKSFDDIIEKLCFEDSIGEDDEKECNSNDKIKNRRNHNNGVNSIDLSKTVESVQYSKDDNDEKDYPVKEIDASDIYFYGNVWLNDPEKRSNDYAVSRGRNSRNRRNKHAFRKPDIHNIHNKRFPEQQRCQYSHFPACRRQRVNLPNCQPNSNLYGNHIPRSSVNDVFRGDQYERHSSRWYKRPLNSDSVRKETMYWISRSFLAIKTSAYAHFSNFVDEKVKPERISLERFDDNLRRSLRRNISRYIFEATRSAPRFVSPMIFIDCIIDTIKNPHNVIEGERQCRQFEQVIGYMDDNAPCYWCEIVFHGGQLVVVRPLSNSL